MKREEAELELDEVIEELNKVKNQISPLYNKQGDLQIRKHKLRTFISAIIDLCEHNWIHDGFTDNGHVKWEKCTICNTTRRV